MTDVFICGAGPVGLTLGIECLLRGLRVQIVDRLENPSDKSRALGVWSATMEALDRIGCAEPIDEAAVKVTTARISSADKTLGKVTFSGRIESKFDEPRLLGQTQTERVLRERLESLGGKVEFGTEVLRFAATDSKVEVSMRTRSGKESVTSARWLVGCDGAHSVVRHGLGLEFRGTAMEEVFLIADVAISPAPDLQSMQIDWQAGSALAIFPIREGMWRVVANRSEKTDPSAPATLEEVHEILVKHGRAHWTASSPEWLTGFRINERIVDTYRVGRVLLAGDAAHIHSPAGGQGMNTGIQDAADLGWRLGLLARGRGDEDLLLSSYSAERRPVAESVLKNSAAMTKAALLSNPAAILARNIGVSLAAKTGRFQNKFSRELAGLDISYAATPLIDDDRDWPEDWKDYGARPGHRIKDVEISTAGNSNVGSLHGLLDHHGHTLLLFSGVKPPTKAIDRLADFARVAMDGVDPRDIRLVRIWCGTKPPPSPDWVIDATGAIHAELAVEWEAAILARPDARVALRSSPPELRAFEDYAHAVFRRALV